MLKMFALLFFFYPSYLDNKSDVHSCFLLGKCSFCAIRSIVSVTYCQIVSFSLFVLSHPVMIQVLSYSELIEFELCSSVF